MIARLNVVIALFLSFLSVRLLSLPLAFHIFFLAAVKSWALVMGKAWIGSGTLINYGYNGPFYRHLFNKTDDVLHFAT